MNFRFDHVRLRVDNHRGSFRFFYRDVMGTEVLHGDVDAAHKELESKDVRFTLAPRTHEDRHVRTAHFHDPDGNVIEISQRIEAAVRRPQPGPLPIASASPRMRGVDRRAPCP